MTEPKPLLAGAEVELLDLLGLAFVKAGSLGALNPTDRFKIMENIKQCNQIILAGAVAKMQEESLFFLPSRSKQAEKVLRPEEPDLPKDASIAEMKAHNLRKIGADLPHRAATTSPSKNETTTPSSPSGSISAAESASSDISGTSPES